MKLLSTEVTVTISSMTAFAHRRSEHPWGTAIWELRSVNHRYLELSFKLPEGLRQLEPELRD
ncbi:YicC/YloC family endoribonuclease, partial [Spongiibacter sp. UBA6593]|uniref:YicC/YloC family endoribonuclease n=1 Tax=Spongiibacter sp. UBA6593 TaxID=1947544 RepID=UPI00257F36DB